MNQMCCEKKEIICTLFTKQNIEFFFGKSLKIKSRLIWNLSSLEFPELVQNKETSKLVESVSLKQIGKFLVSLFFLLSLSLPISTQSAIKSTEY